MDIQTINGLHSCKPGNEPVVGQVKSFVIQHMTSKKGKPYLKIKAANAENGGTPHRILSAEPTDFVDSWGNLSFNIEVEPAVNGQQDEDEPVGWEAQPKPHGDPPQRHANAPQSPLARSDSEDGVAATRKHLMQTSNLLLLCVKAASYVAENMPAAASTGEQRQSIIAQLFIEASHKRTLDGINWFSYVDFMPDKPL